MPESGRTARRQRHAVQGRALLRALIPRCLHLREDLRRSCLVAEEVLYTGETLTDIDQNQSTAPGNTVASLLKGATIVPHAVFDVDAVMWTWTIDLQTGTVSGQQLDDHAVEFPRIDDRLAGLPARYAVVPTDSSGKNSR